jgi:hypothetical protein
MTGQVDVSGKAPGPGGQGAGPDGSHQFGLTTAMALIVGSIIGVGIFNDKAAQLRRQRAAGAGAEA